MDSQLSSSIDLWLSLDFLNTALHHQIHSLEMHFRVIAISILVCFVTESLGWWSSLSLFLFAF